jgi:hypothetical protein
LSTFFVAAPVVIGFRHWLVARDRLPAHADPWFAVVEGALVFGATAVVTGALWWAKRRGLTLAESAGVLFGSTVRSPAWSTPRVAHLLAPISSRVRAPEPGIPAEYERAIAELLPLLPAEVAAVGSLANGTVSMLLRAVDARDRELESLGPDASTWEVERLSARLTALGEAVPDERSERRELRELLHHQLDLVRRMRVRYNLQTQRRAQLVDQLRLLWTLLSAACDACADGSSACSEQLERVRTLCASITDELEPVRQGDYTSPAPAHRAGDLAERARLRRGSTIK